MALFECGGGSEAIIVESGKIIESGGNSQTGAFLKETSYTSGSSVSLTANRFNMSLIIGKCSSVNVSISAGVLNVAGVKNGVVTSLLAGTALSYNGSVSNYDYIYVSAITDSTFTPSLTITD